MNQHQQRQAPLGTAITCDVKGDFIEWLKERKGSVAISTYQAGKVALVGWNGQQISLIMREFDKPMGMARDGDRFALATRDEVILFANAKALANDYIPNERGRYDALYLPRITYTTGELQTHDLAYGCEGLWAVNTRFSCLCQMSESYTFLPRWHPKFVTELSPEDRCHLNGLAMKNGEPAYATALGETNDLTAWKEKKA
ncbi:MAG: DUF4915 domain-containing protein, partial [Planctomycetaceae bacterium]|nr:DUF4915 domain-containing protein [Planctomycetaceae bacterium]